MFKRMVLPRSFLKCITKKKEAQKRKNFVFLNCSVVNQRQLGIAMTDSLTESIIQSDTNLVTSRVLPGSLQKCITEKRVFEKHVKNLKRGLS